MSATDDQHRRQAVEVPAFGQGLEIPGGRVGVRRHLARSPSGSSVRLGDSGRGLPGTGRCAAGTPGAGTGWIVMTAPCARKGFTIMASSIPTRAGTIMASSMPRGATLIERSAGGSKGLAEDSGRDLLELERGVPHRVHSRNRSLPFRLDHHAQHAQGERRS